MKRKPLLLFITKTSVLLILLIYTSHVQASVKSFNSIVIDENAETKRLEYEYLVAEHISPANLFLDQNTVDIIVKGIVTDGKGIPLPGVTVKVKNGGLVTSTDSEGRYSIKVSGTGAVLVFSAVGFETKEATVSGSGSINISLADQTRGLNDVVVVGFGTQKKATVTGSIASIGTKDLVQSPVANISNSLVGRLPGLSATQNSGEPGQDQSTIRIRGVGTFNGNNDPLVLVDGIEVGNFNNIDPNEIESLTILKDASSTAIYGIRGANGVILITSKRGKLGAPQITYSFNQAVNSFTALRKQMNAYDYARNYDKARQNDAYVNGQTFTPRFTADDLAKYQDGSDPLFHPSIDWYDLVLKKTSKQSQQNLNITGGTENTKYFVSAGLYNQDGLFKSFKDIAGFNSNSTYKRYNLRSNFDFNVTKDFKIRLDAATQIENITGSNNDAAGGITNGSRSTNIIERISGANPIDAAGIIDGKIVNVAPSASTNNPLVILLQNGYRRNYSSTLNGSLRFDYNLHIITQGLNVHALINYQNNYAQVINNRKNLVQYQVKANPDGSVYYLANQEDDGTFQFAEATAKLRKIVNEFGFDYQRTFGSHTVTSVLLYQDSKLYNPLLLFNVPNGYQAIRGRVTYNFKGRYLAEFSSAYEGTENFAPGKRFGFFPAYSAGWVVTEEPFFRKNNIITFLKIRGSYGETGNDKINGARFLYNPTSFTLTGPYIGNNTGGVTAGYNFGTVGSTFQSYQGLSEGTQGNPDLTWERAIKRNIAVEMNLFKSNLAIIAEAFSDSRDNILATPQTRSALAGAAPAPTNLGKMSNKGFELSLNYNDHIGEFNYRAGVNYSFARNKILFQDEIKRLEPYQNRTGQRFGQIYGFVADGLYNTWEEVNDPNRPTYTYKIQPGDIRFKDINGDGLISDNDVVPIGYSNIPEKTFGITLGGNYKGFDFSMLFQGAANVSITYSRRFISGFFDNIPSAAVDYLNESWTPERYAQGLPINFPRFAVSTSINYAASTYFTEDASYLRIKNAEVGYTLKAKFLKKVGMNSARLYVNANNLYTWSHVLKGADPESPSLAGNNEPYPLTRTVNIGINAKF